jgi:hypothetical protein
MLHLKVLSNSSSPSPSSLLLLLLLLLLLFIIYIVNLPIVRPWSCWFIYYFNTPTLGIRHHSFDRVSNQDGLAGLIGIHQGILDYGLLKENDRLISNQSELVEEINIRDEYRIIGFQM